MKTVVTISLEADEIERRLLEEECADMLRIQDFRNLLSDFDSWLRANIKYSPDNLSKEKLIIFQEIREKLYEFANERNITIG